MEYLLQAIEVVCFLFSSSGVILILQLKFRRFLLRSSAFRRELFYVLATFLFGFPPDGAFSFVRFVIVIVWSLIPPVGVFSVCYIFSALDR